MISPLPVDECQKCCRPRASLASAALLLLLFSGRAAAQLKIEAHAEKERYIAGEPVAIVFDVTNDEDQPVRVLLCSSDVDVTFDDVIRSVPPNIFGCSAGLLEGTGSCPELDLKPHQTKSFRHLVTGYRLGVGQQHASVSWTARIWPTERQGAATIDRREERFKDTLVLNIVAGTSNEIETIFDELASAADDRDWQRRRDARAAIAEGARPSMTALIARFADEDQSASAINALGRIGTSESRSYLKALFRKTGRAQPVLALARAGDAEDREFLVSIVEDSTADTWARRFAALGVGHVGGDDSVRSLEEALATVDTELRSDVATALGNTRSRLAIPVLIGMYGNNPAQPAVCDALTTITHESWCNSNAEDPAGSRRHWRTRWAEIGSVAPLYGLDECPRDVERRPPMNVAHPEPHAPTKPRNPRLVGVTPRSAWSDSVVTLVGYALGVERWPTRKVLFARNGVEREAPIVGGGGIVNSRPDSPPDTLEVLVPSDLDRAEWTITVDIDGRRSAAISIQIIAPQPAVLGAVTPLRAHPSQPVFVETSVSGRTVDHVELTDSRGTHWVFNGASGNGLLVVLPDDVADGPATIRVGGAFDGLNRNSNPVTFQVTSGPIPLMEDAVRFMRSVAAGQWTDLGRDFAIEFDLARSDKVDIEFGQGSTTIVVESAGSDKRHVHVPERLAPGPVSVRTRTWIEDTPSEWSQRVEYIVAKRAVPPVVASITPLNAQNIWWRGSRSRSVTVERGEVLRLQGEFPVTDPAGLLFELRSGATGRQLASTPTDADAVITIPSDIQPGNWELLVTLLDRSVKPRRVTRLLVR